MNSTEQTSNGHVLNLSATYHWYLSLGNVPKISKCTLFLNLNHCECYNVLEIVFKKHPVAVIISVSIRYL